MCGTSWGAYLKAASFRGLICFGPGEGGKVTFTNPRSWVRGGDRTPVDPDEALREVTRRFLASYAPATAEDLTRWWLGPPRPTIGARMIARLADEAVEVDVDGRRAWVLAADLPAMSAARADERVILLPGFDPWVVGAARHAPLLDAAYQARVFRPQGWISPVVLVGGRIEGVSGGTRSIGAVR